MTDGSSTCSAGEERREGSENALPSLKSKDNFSVAGNSGPGKNPSDPAGLETLPPIRIGTPHIMRALSIARHLAVSEKPAFARGRMYFDFAANRVRIAEVA